MKTLKLWIGIGKGPAEEFDVVILDDDTTPEELNQIAIETFNDLVNFDWEVVDE